MRAQTEAKETPVQIAPEIIRAAQRATKFERERSRRDRREAREDRWN